MTVTIMQTGTTTISSAKEYLNMFEDVELYCVRFYGEQVLPREVNRFFPYDGKELQFQLCYRSMYE